MKRNLIYHGGLRLNKVLWSLVTSTSFFSITFFGNLIVVLFAYFFYLIESPINDQAATFLDCLWWAFATATTVGYGDVIPVSSSGKLLGILLMITGTALFATYTALFAQAILEDEMLQLRFAKDEEQEREGALLEQLKKHKKEVEKQIFLLEKQNRED